MRESKISYHLLVDCQEHNAFTFEDGINMFSVNAHSHTCLNCGQKEGKELLDPNIIEKRNKVPKTLQHISLKKVFY
ncbi:hypothetical protein [Neobacillus bataviensis]|uniref:hypothetical protein n=1 Tax=Neobacillus bataviensis TaxID=220685 RepID=UPI001CBCDACD|nr:hypothetical protein [Neobacillus bataviensis]